MAGEVRLMSGEVDDVFEALNDKHRRAILLGLFESGDSGLEVGRSSSGQSEQAALVRSHLHLPKLDDYGFVMWHRDQNRVVRGPRFGEVEPLLDYLSDREVDPMNGRA
jgi:hypothetical protein